MNECDGRRPGEPWSDRASRREYSCRGRTTSYIIPYRLQQERSLGSSRNGTRAPLHIQPLEATLLSNLLLQLNHRLLVPSRILLVLLQLPAQELIGVVRLEALLQHTKPLAIVRDLRPVAPDVLQVLREVRVAALEDLAVERRAHDGLEVDVLGPGLLGLGQHEVRRLLDGAHERADFVRVLGDEGFVADVQHGAEAAAAQLGELVDAQHLDVGFGARLRGEPLFELDHLHVFEADAGVDLLVDDGFGDVHAAADGGVVRGRHAVVRGELVDLDLGALLAGGDADRCYLTATDLAKLADIANTLALEGAEVRGDAGVLEVDDTGERLVEERTDGEDREVTGFGLQKESAEILSNFDEGILTARVWIIALKPRSTLPVPMISVTSYTTSQHSSLRNSKKTNKHTLGSFGSNKATLIPSSLKYPLA